MKVRRLGSNVVHIAAEDCRTRSITVFGHEAETPMLGAIGCICGVTLTNRDHRVVVMQPATREVCKECTAGAERAARAVHSARN